MKIVVTNKQGFTKEQEARLNSLGDVTYFDSVPETADEYMKRVDGADIICSGTAGLKDAYAQLRDVYVTVGFVSVAFVDPEVMRNNGVLISNAPGANRHAVSEWVIWMMITMLRKLDTALNREETYRKNGDLPKLEESLSDKKLVILGAGNVGKQVGRLAEAFDMEVSFFKRGDNLLDSVQDADVIVDTLSSNKSTEKLLDKDFFKSLKKGSYFITVTREEVADQDAMLQALDDGILAGVATDCGGVLVGDTEDALYKKMLAHPKVFATAHIAYSATKSFKLGNDIMIDNVEAFIKGKPQNLVK
jgi:phosphoglycerate dehydrogenase-like enzyme